MAYTDNYLRRDFDDDRYENRSRRGRSYYDRDDRGAFDRAGDEIRSWFGDEEAERRRRMDERRDPDTNHFRSEDDHYSRSRSQRDRYRDYGDDDTRRGGMTRDYYGRDDRGSRDMMSRDYYGRDQQSGRGYDQSGRLYGGGGSSRYGMASTSSFGSMRDYSGGDRNYGSSQYNRTLSDDDMGNYDDEYRSGRTHFGKGPRNDSRSKERTQERISDMLHDDHDLDASDIEVSTDDNGEVTLSGTVQSRWDKRRAENCAYRVRNVNHVQNNIRIADNDNDSTRSGGASTRATRKSVKS